MKKDVSLLPRRAGAGRLTDRFWLVPIVLCLVSAAFNAVGATLIVTNYADSGPGTLRDRIATANSGDNISFFGFGPVVVNSPLVISKNLRINGSFGSGFKIGGNHSTRVFNVTSGVLEMHNLTIADGWVAGTNGPVGANGENVHGGAFYVASGATLKLNQCIVSNNVAVGGRGGPESQFGSAGNGGNGFGGAIGNFGTLSLVRCTVVSNSAFGGLGGIGTPGLAGSGGQGWGGAIYSGGPADVIRSSLFGNRAVAGIGGNGPGGGAGGAIYNVATMGVSVCTIVSNSASGSAFDFGGGIVDNGDTTVRDSTIVGNQAVYGGGVAGGDYGNTILAGNVATNGPDGYGNLVVSGINLIQNTNGLTLSGAVSSVIKGQDPLLGPLQDHGSKDTEFTPPNMMPLPGSPVIDKGGNFSDSDQRLYGRPYDTGIPNSANGSDIGAIEVLPTSLIVSNNNNSGPGSLRQAIVDNNTLGGGNTIEFATNVTGTILLSEPELSITAPVTIEGPGADVVTVSGNQSTRVFNVVTGPAYINGLTISDGRVIGSPGQPGQIGFDARGAAIFNQHILTVSACILRSNHVVGGIGGGENLGQVGDGGKGLGGAIYNAAGELTLQFCLLEGNSATGGQGGNLPSGEAGDGGNGWGGAAYTGGGKLDINFCSLMNNLALGGPGGIGGTAGRGGQGYGAGLFSDSPARATLSTFGGGRAVGGTGGSGNGSGYGGGIYNLNDLALAVCTVASNSVSGGSFDFGGGIYNLGTLGATNVTIAGNAADYGGGLHGNVTAANSIFAANTATASGADVSGTLNSFDYNLIQSFGGVNFLGATANVIIGQDPLLGPLAYNGGVGLSMALRAGSPAIDKGRNFSLPYDQRGKPRPFDFESVANASGGDGTDIGAFELRLPRLSIAREGAEVVLRWPDEFGNFVLESTPALNGVANWTTVPNTPVAGPGEQYSVTLPAEQGNQFFRLKSR